MIGYRTVMRLAHRWNWHYAPVIGPLEPGDGNDFQRWCHWCGFRQDFRRVRGSNKKQAFVILEHDKRVEHQEGESG